MKTSIAGALALLVLTSTASAENVGEFIRVAKHNNGYRALVHASFMGAARMHNYLALRFETRDAPPVYCPGDALEPTVDEVTDMVAAYLEANPAEKEKPYQQMPYTVIQTMKWKYPCT